MSCLWPIEIKSDFNAVDFPTLLLRKYARNAVAPAPAKRSREIISLSSQQVCHEKKSRVNIPQDQCIWPLISTPLDSKSDTNSTSIPTAFLQSMSPFSTGTPFFLIHRKVSFNSRFPTLEDI